MSQNLFFYIPIYSFEFEAEASVVSGLAGEGVVDEDVFKDECLALQNVVFIEKLKVFYDMVDVNVQLDYW